MSKLFGANWQTTLWGGIFAIATAIAVSPALVEFLPDSIEGYVRGFAAIVVAVSGGKFAAEAKAKNVTGGAVQQDLTGKPVETGNQTLVDLTLIATPSTELSPEQKAIKAEVKSELANSTKTKGK